jgi:hypothetical protein
MTAFLASLPTPRILRQRAPGSQQARIAPILGAGLIADDVEVRNGQAEEARQRLSSLAVGHDHAWLHAPLDRGRERSQVRSHRQCRARMRGRRRQSSSRVRSTRRVRQTSWHTNSIAAAPWEPRQLRSSQFVSRCESHVGRRHPKMRSSHGSSLASTPPRCCRLRRPTRSRAMLIGLDKPCRHRGQDALAKAGGCPALERCRHGDGVLEPYLAVARRLSR